MSWRVLRNQETTEQSCYADRSASWGKSPHVNFAPSVFKWKSTIPDHMENLHVSLNSLAVISCPSITCTPPGSSQCLEPTILLSLCLGQSTIDFNKWANCIIIARCVLCLVNPCRHPTPTSIVHPLLSTKPIGCKLRHLCRPVAPLYMLYYNLTSIWTRATARENNL